MLDRLNAPVDHMATASREHRCTGRAELRRNVAHGPQALPGGFGRTQVGGAEAGETSHSSGCT